MSQSRYSVRRLYVREGEEFDMDDEDESIIHVESQEEGPGLYVYIARYVDR